ncbi:MAG: glycosyltransferase family 9 protein [Nitrospirae bacterium]|nr:glycosyltransferase family 9 protein [Nitrospirota bacterium]
MENLFLECGWKWTSGISHKLEENRPTANRTDIGTIKEILVIFFCGIGDMVVFIPALEALSSFFCKSRISVMTSPPANQLLNNHPCVKSTFSLDAIHQSDFFRKFDLIINLSGHKDEINRILRAANVKHLIIKDQLFDKKCPLHASKYHLELIKGITASFYKPIVYVTGEERRAARKYLIGKRLNPEMDLIIAIHAGSSNPGKVWDWKRFRNVCNLLIRNYGAKILLLSGPSEQEISEKIAESIVNQPVVVQEPLRLIAALLEQCKLLITNDSGVMHLAAAVGTPIVSIFNSSLSQPEIWGPLVDNHVAICKKTLDAIRVEDVMRGVKLPLSRMHKLEDRS